MEHQMANLLNDGEPGKIGRRQLLQALGLSAAGAFVAGAVPRFAWAQAGKTFPVTHVNHLAYAVADYVKSRDFYIELFGMRNAWDDGKGSALEFGDVTNPDGIYIRPVSKPGDKANVGHIAYGISNFMGQKAAIAAEVARRGGKARPDGYAGWSIDDPAGLMIQYTPVKDKAMFPGASPLCPEPGAKCMGGFEAGMKNIASSPKPSGKGFTAIAFSHIAYHVPDIAKTAEFYKNFLGMKAASEKPDEVVLKFGKNTLNLRKSVDNKPHVESFGLLVQNYDHAKAKAELDRRGLKPTEASKTAWRIHDLDGFPIEVAGA